MFTASPARVPSICMRWRYYVPTDCVTKHCNKCSGLWLSPKSATRPLHGGDLHQPRTDITWRPFGVVVFEAVCVLRSTQILLNSLMQQMTNSSSAYLLMTITFCLVFFRPNRTVITICVISNMTDNYYPKLLTCLIAILSFVYSTKTVISYFSSFSLVFLAYFI